jgi:hypothetical protein
LRNIFRIYQVEENEVDRECRGNGGEEERVWVIGGKTRWKEITRKTMKWVNNNKMNLAGIKRDGEDWIRLRQDRD